MKKWLILLFFLVNQVFAQPFVSKVIELHYLSADQVVELLKPLMVEGEQVSGSGQILILKVSPQTLSDIRNVLHKIDVPPVSFTVTVYQGDANWLSKQGNEVVYSTRPQYQSPPSQSVSVLNGQTALVSMDNQIPIVQAIGYGFYAGAIYQQHTVQTGLLVQPILKGSQVQLAVKRIRQQQNVPGSQQFGEQQIDTTIMAPLNKWVALGTTNGSNELSQSSTVYSNRPSFVKNSTLYIKVSIDKTVPGSQ
ncbi:type II/III secretion system protein [Legionella sp. km772]|uniref:type II/III secretion system protein n=1 Tax=Legionella sp. km772 TaxID=2498111 RepID=UPI001F372B2B|nr:type II/III secretion system protein [Legionella sp. km772]